MRGAGRTRSTVASAVVLLAGLSACGGNQTDPDKTIVLPATPSATSGPASELERASMIQFAERAVTVALHRSPEGNDYDADVARAAKLMTPAYTRRFLTLAAASRNDVTSNQITTAAKVLDAGVVAATPVQGRVLVFVDQLSSQDRESPATTQQALLLTLARDRSSWLVSDLLPDAGSTTGAPEPDSGREEILDAAAKIGTLLVNIDYRDVAGALKSIQALGIGEFREEYDDASGAVAKQLVDAKSVMQGTVAATGLVESDTDSATVLVATDGQVSNSATEGLLVARSFRMKLHLTKVHGAWLTDHLEFE